MRYAFVLFVVSVPVWGQNLHATAGCESVASNVLGITSLKDCDIGLTNYGSSPVQVSQAMIREFFPTLDIEDAGRAQAVGDKAFNGSKTSRTIAVINFVAPLVVAAVAGAAGGSGLVSFTPKTAIKVVAGTSLFNTAAQSLKTYLIGQQPNEAAFLPTCPQVITLTPYGTQGFSQVCTVLGSIDYTNSPVVTPSAQAIGGGSSSRGGTLVWNGNVPPLPIASAPHAEIPIHQEEKNFVLSATHPAVNDTVVSSWESSPPSTSEWYASTKPTGEAALSDYRSPQQDATDESAELEWYGLIAMNSVR
jgi:hypothetical protein